MSNNRKPELDHAISLESLDLEFAFNHGFSMSSREILIDGAIDEDAFLEFDAKMTKLENQSQRSITIKINSEGGYPDIALAIVGRIKESKCRIITKGYGTVASAATIILAAGNIRKMSRFCTFMHHEASYGDVDRHSNMKHKIAQIEHQENQWAKFMEEFTNMPASFWLENGIGRDFYLTPEQCLHYGIVDKIF